MLHKGLYTDFRLVIGIQFRQKGGKKKHKKMKCITQMQNGEVMSVCLSIIFELCKYLSISMTIFHFGLYQFNKTTVLYDTDRKHVNFHQNISLYIDWYMIKT